MREFTKFSVVSTIVEYFFSFMGFFSRLTVVAANGQSIIFEVTEVKGD